VAEDEFTYRQWAEPRIAALGETRRAAVALAVASRHLAKLTEYLAAVGQGQTEAGRLLEKAWASFDGQEPLTPDELTEFYSSFAPPRDVSDAERPGVMIASEAFLALVGAIHCVMHGRAREAVSVLESGRVAALAASGVEGEARELALQRRQLDAAASTPGMQELVTVLRRQEDS
jgi:hypothetical protein